MGAIQIILSAGIAILAVGGGSLAQTVPGPSMEDLLKADNDSANWILPAHNYSANRQVEESEIPATRPATSGFSMPRMATSSVRRC